MPTEIRIKDTPEFRKAWYAGTSQHKMAKVFDCSQQSIARAAKRMGLTPRQHKDWSKPEPKNRTREGVRVAEVAGVGTYSGTEIRKSVSLPCEPWINTTQDEPVSEEALRKEWQASVRDLLAEGFGCEDIAVKLWCEPVDVQYEINRLRSAGQIRDVLGGRHA